MANCPDSERNEEELQVLFNFVQASGRCVSHNLDIPIAHAYRGHTLFLKFEWKKPNDEAPVSATIVEPATVDGLGKVVGELTGPWPDYLSALNETLDAAERWIDGQLS